MNRKAALRASIFALVAASLGVVFAACGGSAPVPGDPTGAGGNGIGTGAVGGASGSGATGAAPTSLPASDPTAANPSSGGW